ncbi:MAG: L-2,4-diaminobutyric acid acetyltransferase [Pseudonocardiales bacterium]|jgi:L-2,4-diaminobutyric acid acetyltransferase|nr:L-2,4-diaminobutyric acid acetyltransferase [Pseudonocardiales bacterium]
MSAPVSLPSVHDEKAPPVVIGHPSPRDAGACWELVKATGVLDVNSRYAYALWFRDFSTTSVIARIDGRLAGFVSGYVRPDEPSTLVVWQVAVDESARGRGVAGAMLDTLFEVVPNVDHMETTITPDNDSSIALFSGFAARRSADVQRSELFGSEVLGVEHLPEVLFRIGPITRG